MANRKARVTGTYRMNENELIQFSVEVPNAYPDAIAEAKATVLSPLLHEELADIIEQTTVTDAAEAGE